MIEDKHAWPVTDSLIVYLYILFKCFGDHSGVGYAEAGLFTGCMHLLSSANSVEALKGLPVIVCKVKVKCVILLLECRRGAHLPY